MKNKEKKRENEEEKKDDDDKGIYVYKKRKSGEDYAIQALILFVPKTEIS